MAKAVALRRIRAGRANDPRSRRKGKWQDLLPLRRVTRSISDFGRSMRFDAAIKLGRRKPAPTSSKSENRMGHAGFHTDPAPNQRRQKYHGPFRPYRALSIHR